MNALVKAAQEIRFSIPREILNKAFSNDSNTSLDSKILASVIRPRVLVDCDLVGGISIQIPVNKTELRYRGKDGFVFFVPKKLTNNRSIISVQSLITGNQYGIDGYDNRVGVGGISNTYGIMEDSFKTAYTSVSTSLEIIGENTIMCNDNVTYIPDLILKANVGNDKVALNNISARSHIRFSEMCVLAVKAEIYNRLVIKMGESFIYNGHELGVFKDTVDSYSTANEEYMEFRKHVWSKIAFMNDSNKHNRYIDNQFGSIL